MKTLEQFIAKHCLVSSPYPLRAGSVGETKHCLGILYTQKADNFKTREVSNKEPVLKNYYHAPCISSIVHANELAN